MHDDDENDHEDVDGVLDVYDADDAAPDDDGRDDVHVQFVDHDDVDAVDDDNDE